MSLVVVREAAVVMLEAIFKRSPIRKLVLRLYQNDRHPTDGDAERNYAEADFLGYEAAVLRDWKLETSDPPTLAHPKIGFRSSTGQRDQFVFGYFVTGENGELFWAERFEFGPYPMSVPGDEIQIVPKFALE